MTTQNHRVFVQNLYELKETIDYLRYRYDRYCETHNDIVLITTKPIESVLQHVGMFMLIKRELARIMLNRICLFASENNAMYTSIQLMCPSQCFAPTIDTLTNELSSKKRKAIFQNKKQQYQEMAKHAPVFADFMSDIFCEHTYRQIED